MSGFPWLTALVLLPLAGAAVLVALPAAADRLHRGWATAVAAAEFALSSRLGYAEVGAGTCETRTGKRGASNRSWY